MKRSTCFSITPSFLLKLLPANPLPVPKFLPLRNSFFFRNWHTHLLIAQSVPTSPAWDYLSSADPSVLIPPPGGGGLHLNLISGHLSFHSEPAYCCHFFMPFSSLVVFFLPPITRSTSNSHWLFWDPIWTLAAHCLSALGFFMGLVSLPWTRDSLSYGTCLSPSPCSVLPADLNSVHRCAVDWVAELSHLSSGDLGHKDSEISRSSLNFISAVHFFLLCNLPPFSPQNHFLPIFIRLGEKIAHLLLSWLWQEVNMSKERHNHGTGKYKRPYNPRGASNPRVSIVAWTSSCVFSVQKWWALWHLLLLSFPHFCELSKHL